MPKKLQKKSKIGILGMGKWGRIWSGVIYRSGNILSGTYDPLYNEPKQLEKTVKESDYIIIATPPHTHHQLIEYCLKLGKTNILCEKPMGLSRLTSVSPIMVNFTPCYLDEIIHFDSRCLKGKEIICHRIVKQSPKHDINKFYDLAVHDLAVIRLLIKKPLPTKWFKLGSDTIFTEGMSITVGYRETQTKTKIKIGKYVLNQKQKDPEPLQIVLNHFLEGNYLTDSNLANEIHEVLFYLFGGNVESTRS